MQFSFATVSLAILTLAVASPVPKTSSSKSTKASAAGAGTGASVLTASDYNTIQISSGTAGDAGTKANALFAKIDQTNLAAVSKADLAIISGTHDAAENAEEKAFDPAIAKATGAAKDALNVGKIQNKVLKLTAEVLTLKIKAAQGGSSGDLAAEQTKLTTNIATDKASAGKASTAAPFTASIPK